MWGSRRAGPDPVADTAVRGGLTIRVLMRLERGVGEG
jgi:hypothetical protein